MNPNREPDAPAPHHDERLLHDFGWYSCVLDFPYYPLPSAAFETSGREGARDERWAPSPWRLSAALVLALTWLAVAAAVVLT